MGPVIAVPWSKVSFLVCYRICLLHLFTFQCPICHHVSVLFWCLHRIKSVSLQQSIIFGIQQSKHFRFPGHSIADLKSFKWISKGDSGTGLCWISSTPPQIGPGPLLSCPRSPSKCYGWMGISTGISPATEEMSYSLWELRLRNGNGF